MKLALSFIFLSAISFGQVDTIYCESDSVRFCMKAGRHHYRIVSKGKLEREGLMENLYFTGIWKYYDTITGKLRKEVELCPEPWNTECGLYKEYYSNGNLKEDGFYTPMDSIPCVDCFDYSEPESPRKVEIAELQFPSSIKTCIWNQYYENGKVKTNGEYYPAVHIIFLRIKYDYTEEGQEKTGYWNGGHFEYLKDGEWQCFNKEGGLIAREYYKKGTLICTELIDMLYYNSEFAKKD